jgi:hypothetical protein
MAHHNRADCHTWPCNPGPPGGHHPVPADVDEDEGTAGETIVPVQPPRDPHPDDPKG